jgi:M6 family metalloprotease-like protein
MGIFDPTFDVVGPITIDYSCQYPWPKDENGKVRKEWDANCINIMKAVMEQLKDKVDFSNYDMNNDGFIDLVYVIFAGYGSYVVSNNPKYMWPHANDFSTKVNDTDTQCWSDKYGFPLYNGKKFGRYACGMEIQDREAEADKHVYLDGIGTMCHEFSHVLGLADHYQTDGSLPTAVTPLGYDVMDEGCDAERGLAPVGYSAFERHVLGMADETITVLDKAGNYKLKPFHTNNTAYIVKSAKEGEVFYVENRQKEGWDRTLPGHGLLVWRIDTSDPQRFIKNEPNNFVGQECVQLLGGSPISTANLSPSTNEVWKEKGAAINLFDIKEQDGVISFDASTEATPTGIVDVRSKTEEVRDTDNATYNLAGERVTKEYKGLIIKNGKKMLKR